MDFSQLKQKAQNLKQKAYEGGKKALEKGAETLANSKFTLKDDTELNAFIARSKNKVFKDEKTGVEKTFCTRSVLISLDTKTPFFQELLFLFPVLVAKAYSQNIELKLIESKTLGLKTYQVQENIPTLLVFENDALYKKIEGKDNIEKVVKSFSLDINKVLETIS